MALGKTEIDILGEFVPSQTNKEICFIYYDLKIETFVLFFLRFTDRLKTQLNSVEHLLTQKHFYVSNIF